MAELNTDVRFVRGVGEARAKSLAKLGITDLKSLISYFPRAYEDRRESRRIAELQVGERACVTAMVASEPKLSRIRKGLELVKLRVVDESAALELTYFNQSYLKNMFHVGGSYTFYGTVEGTLLRRTMAGVFRLVFVAGALLSALGYACALPLLRALRCPAEVLPVAAVYLRICSFGLLAQLFYNVATAVLRSLGDSRGPLLCFLASVALNLALEGTGYTFRHYEQSVRLVEVLEKEGRGLNLTWEVRDGMRNHGTAAHPATLEGRVIQLSDKIAYINHDIDDAIRGRVLTEDSLPRAYTDVLGHSVHDRLNNLIQQRNIQTALQNPLVTFLISRCELNRVHQS